MDRLPFNIAEVVVDRLHNLEDLVSVGLVDAQLATGGHQELDEIDLALVLRIPLQQELPGAQAADDVLAGFRAVDSDNCGIGAQQGPQPVLVIPNLFGSGEFR